MKRKVSGEYILYRVCCKMMIQLLLFRRFLRKLAHVFCKKHTENSTEYICTTDPFSFSDFDPAHGL